MVENKTNIPVFVSIVVMLLGFYDLLRGFMHTVMLGYSATQIAVLDLNTFQGGDLLRLLGAFGVTNYITGIMLILLAWLARPLALVMLGVIPMAYGVGYITIHHYILEHVPSTAKWHGLTPFLVYLFVCVITFISALAVMKYRSKSN